MTHDHDGIVHSIWFLFHFIQGVQILAFLFAIVGRNLGYHFFSDFEITDHSLAKCFPVYI